MLKHVNRPRSAIMVGSISTKALVTMHAVKGTRPGWHEQRPRPRFVPATKGPNAMVIGVCKGRNLYTTGSHCPLRYEPSPLSIILARADYAAWHAGLVHLAATLDLSAHVALPPAAAPTPWLVDDEKRTSTFDVKVQTSLPYVPLTPPRARAGAPKRTPKTGPVRFPTHP